MFRAIVTDIFFDLDHTLWDFEKNSALTFEKILAENKIEVDLPDFLRVYVPSNIAFWERYREGKITKAELRYGRLKTVFDELGYHISEERIELLADEYIAHLSSFGHLFPNTIDILEYLKPKYKLHIITNGFQEVQEKKLRNSRIHNYFDTIVDSEMAGVKKPDPLIFEMALTMAKVVPQKALMIGDNLEADIFGAKSAGLHTLHFNAHNEPQHDFCQMIRDLSEIKTLL